jgi:membrane-associated phospholipid phosphatase
MNSTPPITNNLPYLWALLERKFQDNGWVWSTPQMVYRNDGDYNDFPSGHMCQTALICLFYNHLYPSYAWLWLGIAVIIILSTPFTRQHYLSDPLRISAWDVLYF